MKVHELIAKLNDLDSDTEIYVLFDDADGVLWEARQVTVERIGTVAMADDPTDTFSFFDWPHQQTPRKHGLPHAPMHDDMGSGVEHAVLELGGQLW